MVYRLMAPNASLTASYGDFGAVCFTCEPPPARYYQDAAPGWDAGDVAMFGD